MAEENLTRDLGAALSIDFVEKFGQKLKSLHELLGVHSLIPMASGTVIKTYTSSVTLDGTKVAPGAVIPLSKVKMEDGPSMTLEFDKKRKAVTAEDIQKYGFTRAITMTDDKLIKAIQKQVRDELFGQLATGTTTTTETGLQKVMAQNWAAVTTKFPEDDVEVISFVNNFDVATYLGDANITVQTAFGMSYIENFLGNRIVFLHGDIPQGTVYSTATGNLNLAYALMGGELSNAFDLVTDGETGLIGITHSTDKTRLTSETTTMYGIKLFAERLDGIVKGTIEATPGA